MPDYDCPSAFSLNTFSLIKERKLMLTYKVVEINTVEEEHLENALNEWTRLGWRFDTMQFAMRESSRRPSMAFLLFTRDEEE
jgi:hypothetical protein